MRDKIENSESIGLMKEHNEIYRKGYKAACVEIYEKLLKHGCSEEEARKFASVDEEEVENLLK